MDVVVRRDDRLLLLLRQAAHGAGTWSTPGGNLDSVPGEIRKSEEASEYGWFAENSLPEPLFPPLRRLVEGDTLA